MVVLFGSLARGEGTVSSDVDVAIMPGRASPDTMATDVEVALGRALRRPVDVVDLRYAPPLLRFEVARDGWLVLARDPHAWSEFRARAMTDWWDWAPTARAIQGRIIQRLQQKVGDGSS